MHATLVSLQFFARLQLRDVRCDEPDAVVAAAKLSDLAGKFRHFAHPIEFLAECIALRGAHVLADAPHLIIGMEVIEWDRRGIPCRFGAIRHPFDDAPVLAIARNSGQKLAGARHVRQCRAADVGRAPRCFGIGDDAGWSEGRHNLYQERKDQGKSEADVADAQLPAGKPGKQLSDWIGGE